MEVAGEFATLAAARASEVDADAIVVAPETEGDGRDEPVFDEPLTQREIQVLELLAEAPEARRRFICNRRRARPDGVPTSRTRIATLMRRSFAHRDRQVDGLAPP